MLKRDSQYYFNRAASTYDEYSLIQQQAGLYLIEQLLPFLSPQPRIIDLGCGTGWVTEHLAQRVNYQLFHALDKSELLLKQAKIRLSNYAINFYLADFTHDFTQSHRYDLIFANLALHWSKDLTQLLATLQARLTPSGLLAFSLPLAGTFKELSTSQHFYALAEIVEQLQSQHWQLLRAEATRLTATFPSGIAALRSLKLTGVQGARKSATDANLLNWRQRKDCQLTYEIGYFVVKRNGGV